jgi:hypothetical protein
MFPCLCQAAISRSHRISSSALLLRARLLQLGFQLHRKVVARVVVVPALLPQMRRGGLRADFLFLGPVCFRALLASRFRKDALDLRVRVPSTGKSSNSSSSSSCAPGFCGWRGWLVSFESETTALVVFWLPCAAPDMIGEVLWVVCVGFDLVRLRRCCLCLFSRDPMFDRRCNNSDDDARRELGAGCRQSGTTQASRGPCGS